MDSIKLKEEEIESRIARNTIKVEFEEPRKLHPVTSRPRIVSVSKTRHVKEVHAQYMHHLSSSVFFVIVILIHFFFLVLVFSLPLYLCI